MDFDGAVVSIFTFFKKRNLSIATRTELLDACPTISEKILKRHLRQMFLIGLLDIGPSYYIRNDDVFKILNGTRIYINRYNADKSFNAITLTEWIEYISGDDEMRYEGFAEACNPIGESIKIVQAGISVWNNHPRQHKVWFFCGEGNIVVRNPDAETREKMFVISSKLKAVVEDQDGLRYNASGMRV